MRYEVYEVGFLVGVYKTLEAAIDKAQKCHEASYVLDRESGGELVFSCQNHGVSG